MTIAELARKVKKSRISVYQDAQNGLIDLEFIGKISHVVENSKLKSYIERFQEIHETNEAISYKKLATDLGLSIQTIYQYKNKFDSVKIYSKGQLRPFVKKNERYYEFLKTRGSHSTKDHILMSELANLAIITVAEVHKAVERDELTAEWVWDYGRKFRKVIKDQKYEAFLDKWQNRELKRTRNFLWLEDYLKNDKISYDRPAQITRISGLDEIESLDYSYAI